MCHCVTLVLTWESFCHSKFGQIVGHLNFEMGVFHFVLRSEKCGFR